MPDFDQLLTRFRQRIRPLWPLAALIVCGALLTGYLYLQIRTTEYDVSMVVSPVTPPGQTQNNSLVGGAAAALLGLGGNTPSAANSDRYQELLVSAALAARIDRNGPIYANLYSREWDAEAKEWHPPSGTLQDIKRALSEFLGAQPWQAPDAARLSRDLRDTLVFTPVGRSDLFRVTLRTSDPKFGAYLLSTLNQLADSMIREIERKRVTAYLGYLNSELPTVQNAENRTALSQLVIEEDRALMQLSANGVSYATQLVEPPSIPDRPVGLRPLPAMAVSGLLGLLAALAFLALLPEHWLRENFLLRRLARAPTDGRT